MPSTPIELGALLDDWATDGQVRLIETAQAVTVSRLSAVNARQLIAAAGRMNWDCDVHDEAGEPAGPDGLHEALGPFIATIHKPVGGADRTVLTRIGLDQALAEEGCGIWHVACAKASFATGTTSFNPWGGGNVFSIASATKSPLDLVRESSEIRLVPTDVRKWTLRAEVTDTLWQDVAFQIFAKHSILALVRCLATEIIGSNTIVFRGPPRLNVEIRNPLLLDELQLGGYRSLQASVAWVYEDTVSAEQRHALFGAEFARAIHRNEPLGDALRTAGRDILEGCRLAFQLSQSELSREAIKAQADLRRAIADDTSKAADGTRNLSTAIAVAIATGITLVAARSTGTTDPWVLSVVAGVVALYLFCVAVVGWIHLHLQNRLRDQWRRRFYRFIPADDYEAMVTKPTRAAEWPYHFVGTVAVLVAFGLSFLAVKTGSDHRPLDLITKQQQDPKQNEERPLPSSPAPAPNSPPSSE